jgi:hypothetical protein
MKVRVVRNTMATMFCTTENVREHCYSIPPAKATAFEACKG